jgi:hypothetical protein
LSALRTGVLEGLLDGAFGLLAVIIMLLILSILTWGIIEPPLAGLAALLLDLAAGLPAFLALLELLLVLLIFSTFDDDFAVFSETCFLLLVSFLTDLTDFLLSFFRAFFGLLFLSAIIPPKKVGSGKNGQLMIINISFS